MPVVLSKKLLQISRLCCVRKNANKADGPSLFSFIYICLYHPGYSEDGGIRKGEIIPEHEFAAGPICLDDENEFPPVSMQK